MSRPASSLSVIAALALVPALLALVPAAAAPPSASNDYQCTTSAGPSGGASAPEPTKIMIAGDSVANASVGDYTWPYWLWRDQVARGANIDFVGRFRDTIDAGTGAQGSRQYLDCGFDQDKEARPGVKLWTGVSGKYAFGSPTDSRSSPLLPYYPGASSWIKGAVETYGPDLLILAAGANDLFRFSEENQGSKSEAEIAAFVIDKLKNVVIAEARAANPQLDLVLTTVPVPAGAPARYTLYNGLIQDVVDADTSPGGSDLVLAQLPSWANDTWDGVHPDAVGEVAIAAVMADALNALNPAVLPRPAVLPTPALGPRVAATLSASPAGDNQASLSWTMPPGADRTVIWSRDLTTGGAWTMKADLVHASLRRFFPDEGTAACDPACTTYTVTGLDGGHDHEFAVQLGKGLAIATDVSSQPQVVSVTGSVLLGRVSTLAPVAGIHNVSVRWSNLQGVTAYDVRWRVAGSSAYSVTTASGSPRVISGLVAGRRYGFQVRAREGSSTGAWSQEVQAIPRANALATGRLPVLKQVTGLRIRATWAASAGANKYQLLRRVGTGRWVVVATTTTRSVLSGKLVKGKTYQFRVRPFDGLVGGKSSPIAQRKIR